MTQLCLAHSFGATPADNAKNTVRAVEWLLDGLKIDEYYMIDYTALPVLNDALGGITVKIQYDMEQLNPAWAKGNTVSLHGGEAETFVRARLGVGTETNEERMTRQSEFMSSAIGKMKGLTAADASFGRRLLERLEHWSVSNISSGLLAEEMLKARDYDIPDVDYLEGEYMTGRDGFTEFHVREGAAEEWILEHLYSPLQ